MPSIVFICRHNACRSQIAEAILRKAASSDWVIESAGFNPSGEVDPKAVEVLKNYRLTMKSSKPKGFSALPPVDWDYVVNMDSRTPAPDLSGKKLIRWNIPDPQDGPMSLYEALFEELDRRIRKLIQK